MEVSLSRIKKDGQNLTNIHKVHVGNQRLDFSNDLGLACRVKGFQSKGEDGLLLWFLLQFEASMLNEPRKKLIGGLPRLVRLLLVQQPQAPLKLRAWQSLGYLTSSDMEYELHGKAKRKTRQTLSWVMRSAACRRVRPEMSSTIRDIEGEGDGVEFKTMGEVENKRRLLTAGSCELAVTSVFDRSKFFENDTYKHRDRDALRIILRD